MLALAFTILHAGRRDGWRAMGILFILSVGITLFMESLGVATGWPFGNYHYTEYLGPLFLGLVPYVIPIIWFVMIYPTYVMAVRLWPQQRSLWMWRLGVAALAGLMMASWDLALDPVMVQRGHWVWESPGQYFGIPLQNYAGWWLTTFIAVMLYLWLAQREANSSQSTAKSFDRLAVYSYAIMGTSHFIGAYQIDLGGPALAGFLAMLPWIVLTLIQQR